MVGDERTGGRTSGYRLQNGCFDFQISTRVEIFPHGGVHFVPFDEYIFYSFVYHQVYIALTITELGVFESVVGYPVFPFYDGKGAYRFGKYCQFLRVDRYLSHLGAEYKSANTDEIADVEQLFEYGIV